MRPFITPLNADRTLAAARCGGRDYRLNLGPLRVGQVVGVAQTAAACLRRDFLPTSGTSRRGAGNFLSLSNEIDRAVVVDTQSRPLIR
jgi:hypothetical protein